MPGFLFRSFLLLLLLLGSLGGMPSGAKADANPLILGVHPYLPDAELRKRFRPLARYLSAALAQPVTIRIAANYQDHMLAFQAGRVDMAFVGPSLYVEIKRKQPNVPLLAQVEIQNQPFFHGHIVVSRSSPVQSLLDLRGRSVAFGDPKSTMSHLVPRKMLERCGITLSDFSRYRFHDDHRAVAMAVLNGEADAGAIKDEVYEQFRSRGIRSIAQSPPMAEHLFVGRSGLPTPVVLTLRSTLLSTRSSPEGLAALRAINASATGLITASDTNYDSLREILKPHDHTSGTPLPDYCGTLTPGPAFEAPSVLPGVVVPSGPLPDPAAANMPVSDAAVVPTEPAAMPTVPAAGPTEPAAMPTVPAAVPTEPLRE
ncbi:MAG: phosphate/phosphite/phosphonate ABC transporter substrate-binding protein [Magnetococcus sp. WYHC-3]